MSEQKHTPGPWTLAPCSHGGLILRRGDAIGRDTHIQSSLQILPEADAHLIAAAPDLLQACKVAFVALAAPEWGEVQDQIRAAIAKAEGR